MEYLLLTAAVLVSALQNIFLKQYNIKTDEPNLFLFSTVSALTAMIFFAASARFQFDFSAELLPYSLAFGIAYSAAMAGTVIAVKTGPLSVTSLVISYSLIIPTIYGIFFLKDSLSAMAYPGIVLLLLSLVLINKNGGEKKEGVKLSLKWLLWAAVAFVGNGMCSTVQKMQQMKFEGAYKSEFMIAALLIVTVLLFAISLVQRRINGQRGREDISKELMQCSWYAPAYGVVNGINNLSVMFLTALLPNAVLFPSISAGGIVAAFVIAVFLYKERLSRIQLIGYAAGVISIILLNI